MVGALIILIGCMRFVSPFLYVTRIEKKWPVSKLSCFVSRNGNLVIALKIEKKTKNNNNNNKKNRAVELSIGSFVLLDFGNKRQIFCG